MFEKALGARSLDQPSLMQKQNFVGHAPCLSEAVGDHEYFRACAVHGGDDSFDFLRRAGVEASSRLVEEKNFGAQRPRARQREPLLLSSGEHARRVRAQAIEPDFDQGLACPLLAMNAWNPGNPKRVQDIGKR